VKAWITLDGVFDADTMDYWWQNTNNPELHWTATAPRKAGPGFGGSRALSIWPGSLRRPNATIRS
jgi:hypothetical protein